MLHLNKMDIHEINVGKLTICEGIIRLQLNDRVDVKVRDIEEIHEANQKLCDGSKYCLLVIVGKYSSVTPEARELAASKELSKNRISLAFVTNSLAHKLVVNFFIKFNRPNTPTKLFSDENEANMWLKGKTLSVF